MVADRREDIDHYLSVCEAGKKISGKLEQVGDPLRDSFDKYDTPHTKVLSQGEDVKRKKGRKGCGQRRD